METKGKCGAEIRRRKPDNRSSETQECGLAGRRHGQISHREKIEKAKLGVASPLYPRIVRNARNGDERTRPDQSQSNQIRPNQTGLTQTSLDFGPARWMRGNGERMTRNAKCLNDCFTYDRGSGLEENLRLFSLILAYLRLIGKKMLRAPRAATGECGGRKVGRRLLREESADGLQFLAARLVGFGIAQTQCF